MAQQPEKAVEGGSGGGNGGNGGDAGDGNVSGLAQGGGIYLLGSSTAPVVAFSQDSLAFGLGARTAGGVGGVGGLGGNGHTGGMTGAVPPISGGAFIDFGGFGAGGGEVRVGGSRRLQQPGLRWGFHQLRRFHERDE